MSGIDKFLKVMDDVTKFIIGEKRSGTAEGVTDFRWKITSDTG